MMVTPMFQQRKSPEKVMRVRKLLEKKAMMLRKSLKKALMLQKSLKKWAMLLKIKRQLGLKQHYHSMLDTSSLDTETERIWELCVPGLDIPWFFEEQV
uniref:Uncharacterized protein n=1 Tax=Romanomermis culicivorax TaxID=13658 RepID=A0A915KUL4_ROMCU